MTLEASVAVALGDWAAVTLTEAGGRLSTQCLYPSNQAVCVNVAEARDGWIVTDDRGAVDEVTSAGFQIERHVGTIAEMVRKQGLRFEGDAIRSPRVGQDELTAAILLVANASKEVAHWCYDRIGEEAGSEFGRRLADLLQNRYGSKLQRRVTIRGKSSKQWQFDYLLHGPANTSILIDAVHRDPPSINARQVANMDVRLRDDAALLQCIVFDDREDWGASDLALLSLAATVVPFSDVEKAIDRLMAAG